MGAVGGEQCGAAVSSAAVVRVADKHSCQQRRSAWWSLPVVDGEEAQRILFELAGWWRMSSTKSTRQARAIIVFMTALVEASVVLPLDMGMGACCLCSSCRLHRHFCCCRRPLGEPPPLHLLLVLPPPRALRLRRRRLPPRALHVPQKRHERCGIIRQRRISTTHCERRLRSASQTAGAHLRG